ncbi:MAG: zinc ribbon domain-containing protein [Clostridia bacterium]|nr:zinc ribbon domain-containing protein [Clostridia bacterium]MBR3554046.1 zinc ribbon domain-containing protein [Clostridia bacterium]
MYCQYCGHEIQTYERYCKHCGALIQTETLPFMDAPAPEPEAEPRLDDTMALDLSSEAPPAWEPPPRYGRPLNPAQLIISLLAVLNVIFLPLFSAGSGVFPSEMRSTFLEVVTGKYEIYDWPVALTALIFLPSMLMTVLSILKAQITTKLTGLVGLILMVGALLKYVDEFSLDALFSLENGNLSIGLWIAFLLFIVMLFIPIDKKRALD